MGHKKRAKVGFRTCAYGVVKECIYRIVRAKVQRHGRHTICAPCHDFLHSE